MISPCAAKNLTKKTRKNGKNDTNPVKNLNLSGSDKQKQNCKYLSS